MIDRIIKIISNELGTKVDANASQTTCENWDSLRHLNIVVALEEAFDVSFEPEDIANMRDISTIEQFIQQNI